VSERIPDDMKTIAIVNNKGGQGKTTTAVSLGAAWALKGYRVLLVDFDPQASATAALGIEAEDCDTTIAEIMEGIAPITQAVLPTSIEGLDLVPARPSLAEANLYLVQKIGREARLKKELARFQDQYHFCLIDCPPSTSLLTVNAIVAAQYIIIPVTPDFLSMKGLAQLQDILREIRSNLDTDVRVLGILPTMVDYRKGATHEALEILRENFKELVFKNEIRINVRLEEAPSHGKTIFQYDPRSVGAECYWGLAEEVLQRCRRG
jgi:chromosome partitioning protein